jgi:hypothetical protein
MLHGKTHDQLRKISCCRLVLAPKTHQTIDQLIQWLVCPDSNLIPPQEWLVSVREAAFLAIISKLIRGRRWANDCSGHSFLKKNDLINQSPVQRSGYEAVRISAVEQLNLLITEGILLKKGAEQGKTPLEFAINSIHLKQLKQLMTNRSFISLTDQAFQKILNFIRHDQTPKNINALDGIVTAQTIEQCQKQNNSENV